MRSKSKRKPIKNQQRRRLPDPFSDDEVPEDVDEFRNALARGINMFINTWQGCPEPVCRRARRCMAPNIGCSNAPPLNLSEEEKAKAIADVYKKLREVVAQHGEG